VTEGTADDGAAKEKEKKSKKQKEKPHSFAAMRLHMSRQSDDAEGMDQTGLRCYSQPRRHQPANTTQRRADGCSALCRVSLSAAAAGRLLPDQNRLATRRSRVDDPAAAGRSVGDATGQVIPRVEFAAQRDGRRAGAATAAALCRASFDRNATGSGHCCAREGCARRMGHARRDGRGQRDGRIADGRWAQRSGGRRAMCSFVVSQSFLTDRLHSDMSASNDTAPSPARTQPSSRRPRAALPSTGTVRLVRPSFPRQRRDECGRRGRSGSWTAQSGSDSVGRRTRRQSD